MGGRSGQGIRTVNSGVSEGDYKATQSDDHYQSNFNGDYNAKTINAYTERGFMQVNGSLRRGSSLTSVDKQYIKNLDKALNKLPNHKGIVYRLLSDRNKELLTTFKGTVGKVISWKGYTSTTSDRNNSFLDSLHGHEKVFFVIRSKRGKNIKEFSGHAYEQEVLFKRNSKFKVVAYRNDKFYLKEL